MTVRSGCPAAKPRTVSHDEPELSKETRPGSRSIGSLTATGAVAPAPGPTVTTRTVTGPVGVSAAVTAVSVVSR